MGKRAKASEDIREGNSSPVEENESDREEWLLTVIDVLAAEYHWSKSEILEEVYPEEIEPYLRKISERKKLLALEQVYNHKILLEAVTAPYTEGGKGARNLLQHLNEVEERLKKSLAWEVLERDEDHIVKALREHREMFG